MKDLIVSAYLKDFVEEFALNDLTESEAFERFASYFAVSKHYPEPFDPDDVGVGGGNDLGIDGLAVIVNDHLVFSREAIDHLKKTLRRLDAQFIFVQAKTSPHFEAADIGTFIAGVRAFFSDNLSAPANEAVCAFRALKEHIYDSSRDMDRSPVCRLYYVSLGTWTGDPTIHARIDQGVADLKGTGIFSSVEFVPLDAEAVKRIHRELHHKITRQILFEKHTILPQIGGVQEAYIGIVPCVEYLKLITDDEGALNRRLFYDNVRDFLGHNSVNLEIESTVRDAARNDRFALLNNGVTIVSRDVTKVGAKFNLRDYQVVNGCQTSHILHLNRIHLTDKIYLPIKLIVTSDSEVTNQIIQGTNRQTEVKLEAFETLASFQKTLEEFYIAVGRERPAPLYYERRAHQYDHLDLQRDCVISLATQINCFVAMFLNEPHSTHRYYGELLTSYRGRLFSDSHSAWPYFLSGAAFSALERLIADGAVPRAWKPMRFQILMVFRIQNQARDLPYLNSKAVEQYCQELLRILDDSTAARRAMMSAGDLTYAARSNFSDSREPPERTRAFTEALMSASSSGRSTGPGRSAKVTGTVKWFSDVRGFGFITSDDGREVFVGFRNIQGQGWRTLTEGQRVSFTVVRAHRGDEAGDVQAL